MTWNMSDIQAGSSGVNVIADYDPELDAEAQVADADGLPAKVRKTDGKTGIVHSDVLAESTSIPLTSTPTELSQMNTCYNRDDLVDIFDLHISNCRGSVQIYRELKTKKQRWSCKIAKFHIRFSTSPIFVPLPVDGLTNVENMTLHIAAEGENNILWYDLASLNRTGTCQKKPSKYRECSDRNIQFWLVHTDLTRACLEALKCRQLQVVIDCLDTEEMCLSLFIMATEDILLHLPSPSDAVRPRMLNESLKALMQHFHQISTPGMYIVFNYQTMQSCQHFTSSIFCNLKVEVV